MATLFLSPPTTTTKVFHHQHNLTTTTTATTTFPSTITKTPFKLQATKKKTSDTNNYSNNKETVLFDGGAHYGDLVANLAFGVTLLWLPLTIAAVSRALFLRYRFTDLRVTVVSGLTGQDRADFPYSAIKQVQVVPRFIGEWGDIVITLTDGTNVDLRSVPRFREIASYCLQMSGNGSDSNDVESSQSAQTRPKGF